MKGLNLAKRNILEYLRSHLTLFFTLAFPVLMFLVFQLIKTGTGATDDITPMFSSNNLTASISVFSYSFVSLCLSQQISKDRDSSLQARLSVSPLNRIDFFIGYLTPALIITVVQTVLAFILGLCFGLTISIRLIPAMLSLVIISIFYISLGLILGSLLSEKSAGGVSSIVIQVTALFSGMFFPLTDGVFKTVLTCFPFLPSITIPQSFISGNYQNIFIYLLSLCIYFAVAIGLAVWLFGKRLKNK